MLTLTLYILASLLLLVCIRQGLTAKMEKRTAGWLVTSRLILFMLMIAKIVSFFLVFSWLTLLQFCLLIVALLLVEIAFRRKRMTFGDPHLNNMVELLVFIILAVIIW